MGKPLKNLYLIGGGGHCHSCIDVIEQTGEFKIQGIFDIKENISKKVLGYKIIGTDEDLIKYISTVNYFLVTIGQIKSAIPRMKIFDFLVGNGARMAVVISPRAYVSLHSTVGAGTIVMHDVLINSNVLIGVNCILNTKCLVEHDSKIEAHCHVSTAAVVNGNCTIESKSFIGSNAVLKEGITIKESTLISAGGFYRGR